MARRAGCREGVSGSGGDQHRRSVRRFPPRAEQITIPFMVRKSRPQATWAMMILGFAGVGFMTYRRRNQTTAFRMA